MTQNLYFYKCCKSFATVKTNFTRSAQGKNKTKQPKIKIKSSKDPIHHYLQLVVNHYLHPPHHLFRPPHQCLITITIPARVVIPIIECLVKEENPFNFCNSYQNLQCSTTWKLNVFRITSTQTWKIISMWKFSFCEHLSSSHWPMNGQNFYPQVQILHKCIVTSLWVESLNTIWLVLNVSNWFVIMTSVGCAVSPKCEPITK